MRPISPAAWLRMVLVASLVVPSAVLGVTAWLGRQHALDAAERQIATTVSLLREQTTRVLQSDELTLDLVEEMIQGMDWAEINNSRALQARLAALLVKSPQVASIALVAPDGLGSNNNLAFPHQQVNVTDRDYYLALRDHPEIGTFISRTYPGRVTHRLQFNVARRRGSPDGRFDGLIVLSTEPTYLSTFYSSFAGAAGMAIGLLRADGVFLARYPPLLRPVDLAPDNAVLIAARQRVAGPVNGQSAVDGIFRMAGFARVGGYPLLISYGISRAGVLSEWRQELLVYGPLTGAAALALAMMTWLALRGELKLAAGRRRLEALNEDLAHQIVQRARAEAELRELNIALEQRVAERTASLSELADQLERERVRLVTLIEASPFAELLVGQHGEILMTNIAAEALFGYRRDELIGRNVDMLVPPRLRQGHAGKRDGFFATATARPMGAGLDVVALRRDGSEVSVEVLLSPQLTPSGPVVIVGIADVSARRTAQAALLHANIGLVAANRELVQANATVRRKNEEVEAFVYIVSHDLRGPLVNLQGFSRELERGCAALRDIVLATDVPDTTQRRLTAVIDEDITGTLPYITASVSKFDRLINALLELSRTGQYPLHLGLVDVPAVLNTTLDSLRRQIDDSGARVSVGTLPGAIADVTALGQIFSNLITNALKFAAPDRAPAIDIGGEVAGEVARYWVRDNGIGIPQRAKPRLFQVFQRFHPGVASGDGIGLATVRRLVERLDGTIWAESEVGVGSAFQFTLPTPRRRPGYVRESIRAGHDLGGGR